MADNIETVKSIVAALEAGKVIYDEAITNLEKLSPEADDFDVMITAIMLQVQAKFKKLEDVI